MRRPKTSPLVPMSATHKKLLSNRERFEEERRVRGTNGQVFKQKITGTRDNGREITDEELLRSWSHLSDQDILQYIHGDGPNRGRSVTRTRLLKLRGLE